MAIKYLKITVTDSTILEMDPLFRDMLQVTQIDYSNVRSREDVREQE